MQHDNCIMDTRVYEVEYIYLHQASLADNNVAEIYLSKVGEEGNRFVLFDDIVDHIVDGTYTMHQDAFVI